MWSLIFITWALSMAFIIYLIATAPEGYEDETGFHYGKKDEDA